MDATSAPAAPRRAADDRLERAAAEERYAELFENAQIGICITRPGGTLVACNPAFARMLGFSSVDEVIGTTMAAHYVDSSDRRQFLDELRQKKRLDQYRTRLRARDGRVVHVVTSVVGQFDQDGALVEIRGYILDITANVEAEAALLERERLFRAVVFGASDAVLILDDRRVIAEANPAAAALFGISAERLAGESLDNLIDAGARALPPTWAELMGLGEARQEYRINSGSGPRIVECSFRARVRDDRHLCIARDITDRRLLEERLAQAARIESVGRLAGGIAHDFNNLLTAILGYTELLLSRRVAGDPERNDLEEIQKAGQRASMLTQQLLAFGRKQMLQPQELDLNRTVAGLQPMLTRVLREDIALHIELASQPAYVTVDPHQIEQAILNLVLNARDALPMGGFIRIEVAQVTLSPDEMPGARPGTAGPHVCLRIVDNGTGIDPEARAHLFEPFFTTKGLGKGTGLGLASVHGIVHQSGGFILVDSPASGGSIFSLYFPAASRAVAPQRPVQADPATEGRETILLVEDEDSVRAIVGAVLRRQGYQVLEAATPHGASEIFKQHSQEIDLLLTDVVMPGMNGPALAQRLVAERPGLRVLFMSGYADGGSLPLLKGPNVRFLGKPFQASALTGAVREILDRRDQKAAS